MVPLFAPIQDISDFETSLIWNTGRVAGGGGVNFCASFCYIILPANTLEKVFELW